MKTSSLVVIAVLSGVLMAGCGRSNTVYGGDDGIVSGGNGSVLPKGFQDQSVNSGSVSTSADFGMTATLNFMAAHTSSSGGAFNDSALTGNRAILGVSKYDDSLVRDFSLALTSESNSSSTLHISLLIDLKCNGVTALRTLESSELASGSSNASPSDAVWSVDGAALKDSANHLLLASRADSTPSTLTALLAAYPMACLKRGHSDAPDAPLGAVAGLLISTGSAATPGVSLVSVSSLTINNDVYQTWGRP